MISAKSFNQTLYTKLKLIVTIQKYLSKLTITNLEEIGTNIFYLNDISKSESGMLILARCFKDESDFHPKNIEILADLFIFLVERSDSSNYFHLLKEYTASCIHTHDKIRSSFLFFLRTLLNRKSITIDLIIREISLMLPLSSKTAKKEIIQKQHSNDKVKNESQNENINETKFNFENENFSGKFEKLLQKRYKQKKYKVINWFYPEIYASNPRFIQLLQNDINYTILGEFNTNDFSSILQIMNTGYSIEKLAQIIRNDDIDSFTQIVSQIGQSFDFNQKVKSTKFERSILLRAKPTLIQYSAFFGSLKIFKFLYLNKADIEIVSNNMYTISHYAICGGCSEIIHILSQNNVNFLSGIPISIQFFHNDIFQWLIENYAPKSEDDFESMNYYACNLKFNHRNRQRHFTYLNHQFDSSDDDYYQLKNCDGKLNEPIRKVVVRKSYPHQSSSDYSDSDVIVNEEKNEEEDKNDEFNAAIVDDFFKFFDFDLLFESIVDSENYLSLFLLFDHGMSINTCNKNSGKTLLHYAIQKGKTFLVDLLLSNELIDVSLKDKNDQTPIVYSVKYSRVKIFFTMIKMQKILDTMSDQDYIQIAFYAMFLELNEISEYLMNNWSINLTNLMETNEIKTFCDAISYLPFNFLKDQIEDALIESFKSRRFEYFSIMISRIFKDKNICISATFYFTPKAQCKSGKEKGKDFAGFFQLLIYYLDYYSRGKSNYYKLYLKDFDGRKSKGINYESMNQFEKEKKFCISSDDNYINVYLAKDSCESHDIKMEIRDLN